MHILKQVIKYQIGLRGPFSKMHLPIVPDDKQRGRVSSKAIYFRLSDWNYAYFTKI